jgi:hypothetical protein
MHPCMLLYVTSPFPPASLAALGMPAMITGGIWRGEWKAASRGLCMSCLPQGNCMRAVGGGGCQWGEGDLLNAESHGCFFGMTILVHVDAHHCPPSKHSTTTVACNMCQGTAVPLQQTSGLLGPPLRSRSLLLLQVLVLQCLHPA